jgi:cell division protein FtsB
LADRVAELERALDASQADVNKYRDRCAKHEGTVKKLAEKLATMEQAKSETLRMVAKLAKGYNTERLYRIGLQQQMGVPGHTPCRAHECSEMKLLC